MSAPLTLSCVLAFSYIRFSSPRQAEGDSLRRQTDAAADWCKRHGATLDTSLTLHDLGRSAFSGKHRVNPDRNALAAFLKLVQDGRVPRGSCLIVESLDRLTREHIRPALTLLLGLIDAGIRVVQLKPAETVYGEDVEPMQVMMMIMELSRGHSESAVKSDRCREAWAKKKEAARAGTVMTRNAPRWFKRDAKGLAVLANGKLVIDPDRAALVKRVFALAAAGYGLVSIVRTLTAEGFTSFGGRRKDWTRSYLALILKDRRALGEHQPTRGGKPDGPPIPGYFPAVVTEDEFRAASAGRAQRRKRPGRIGKHHVNIFAGLLTDALSGGAYYMSGYKSAGKPVQVLANIRATEGLTEKGKGKSGFRSFRYDLFESGVLATFKELKLRHTGCDEHPERIAVLEGECNDLKADIASITTDLDQHGYSKALSEALRKKEGRLEEVTAALEEQHQKAAHPTAQALDAVKSLADQLADSADQNDTRLRLRAALRRLLDDKEPARILVTSRGQKRIAVVQFYFAGGGVRGFALSVLPASAPGGRVVREEPESELLTFAKAGIPANTDLRDPAAAERLAERLSRPASTETKRLRPGAG